MGTWGLYSVSSGPPHNLPELSAMHALQDKEDKSGRLRGQSTSGYRFLTSLSSGTRLLFYEKEEVLVTVE